MRVKCLAQEHNTMTRPGLEPGPFDPEFSMLTIRPLRLPPFHMIISISCLKMKQMPTVTHLINLNNYFINGGD